MSELYLSESGTYTKKHIGIAICSGRSIDTIWAIHASMIQFPPSSTKSVFCYPHQITDVSRNMSIRHWLAKELDENSWLLLLTPDAFLSPQVITNVISSGHKIVKIKDCYVIHRSVATGMNLWFKNNTWMGTKPFENDEIFLYQRKITPSKIVVSENNSEKSIAIAIPSLGKTSSLWLAHAIQLLPLLATRMAIHALIGHEIGKARETLIEDIGNSSKYILFYGDDNLPPSDGLSLLFDCMQKTNSNAVSGLYYMKHSPPDIPVMWQNNKNGPLNAGEDFKLGEPVQVDGSGLDFCLFKTEALLKVPRPRFKTVSHFSDQGMLVQTEDAYFWEQWRKIHTTGPLVDTRCRVGHFSVSDNVIYGV